MAGQSIRIALLGYDGLQTLDLTGPLDAFSSANDLRRDAYETLVVTLDGNPFASESGLKITPDCALADAGLFDTLILPGGASLRRPGMAGPIASALIGQAPRLRRLVSVCTGIDVGGEFPVGGDPPAWPMAGGSPPTGNSPPTSPPAFRPCA